jgi:hypothetical protein
MDAINPFIIQWGRTEAHLQRCGRQGTMAAQKRKSKLLYPSVREIEEQTGKSYRSWQAARKDYERAANDARTRVSKHLKQTQKMLRAEARKREAASEKRIKETAKEAKQVKRFTKGAKKQVQKDVKQIGKTGKAVGKLAKDLAKLGKREPKTVKKTPAAKKLQAETAKKPPTSKPRGNAKNEVSKISRNKKNFPMRSLPEAAQNRVFSALLSDLRVDAAEYDKLKKPGEVWGYSIRGTNINGEVTQGDSWRAFNTFAEMLRYMEHPDSGQTMNGNNRYHLIRDGADERSLYGDQLAMITIKRERVGNTLNESLKNWQQRALAVRREKLEAAKKRDKERRKERTQMQRTIDRQAKQLEEYAEKERMRKAEGKPVKQVQKSAAAIRNRMEKLLNHAHDKLGYSWEELGEIIAEDEEV